MTESTQKRDFSGAIALLLICYLIFYFIVTYGVYSIVTAPSSIITEMVALFILYFLAEYFAGIPGVIALIVIIFIAGFVLHFAFQSVNLANSPDPVYGLIAGVTFGYVAKNLLHRTKVIKVTIIFQPWRVIDLRREPASTN